MEMCAVKVANALDTTFEALVSTENEWAQVAGRRRSVADGRLLSTEKAASAAAAAQASLYIIQSKYGISTIYTRLSSLSPFPALGRPPKILVETF